MFLYGMHLMGDGLQASASGPLKTALEKLTSTPLRAFLLGLAITAIIQSSKATIVITAGLVATGILSVRQSAGIIVGANIGTTVTGQIIRLMDLNSSGFALLELFNPSTLAPVALIVGVVLTMTRKKSEATRTSDILIGFGILFSGLMTMTDSVSSLTESEMTQVVLASLGDNLFLAFAVGAGLAFILQSASASVGVLQAFSTSGLLSFAGVSVMLLGIFLGDSLTTGFICWIGAKPNSKKVGVINLCFNVFKVLLVGLGLLILGYTGLLSGMWNASVTSGQIADANTLYNVIAAVLLFPFLGLFVRISDKLVKADTHKQHKYEDLLDALNPAFFNTPALAFGRCYDALLDMYHKTVRNISLSLDLVEHYDEKTAHKIVKNEKRIDEMSDRITNYLVELSAHISAPNHLEIMSHYYTVTNELERMSDHALNIKDIARDIHQNKIGLPKASLHELNVLREILNSILDYGFITFSKRDVEAAKHIEPLEQVVDDIIAILKERYLKELNSGECSVFEGTEMLNLLAEIERLSDLSSNIGVATIARVYPNLKHKVHEYIHQLHKGEDEEFNKEYKEAQVRYFSMLRSGVSPS